MPTRLFWHDLTVTVLVANSGRDIRMLGIPLSCHLSESSWNKNLDVSKGEWQLDEEGIRPSGVVRI